MTNNPNIRFEDWLAEEMHDPEFRQAMEALEPAYQVARLRMMRGLTQKELAKLVGTRQSSISRLESGKSQPSVSFLRRVAKALKARLIIGLAPEEDSLSLAAGHTDVARDQDFVLRTAVFGEPTTGARAVFPVLKTKGITLILSQSRPVGLVEVVDRTSTYPVGEGLYVLEHLSPWQMMDPSTLPDLEIYSTREVAR